MNGRSNGARFIRTVNDGIHEVLVKWDVEDGEFSCECDDPTCEERVIVTLREYSALRDRNDGRLVSRAMSCLDMPQ